MQTLEERFWSKVDKSGDCWIWTAGKTSGYGVFAPKAKVACRAHRWAYEDANGPIPAGAFIDHMCHNRACVRPSHLRLADYKQNQENRSGANKNSKSGVQGVHWSKCANKWHAQVQHKGKRHNAGLFESLEDAARAVAAKRNELFTYNTADR